MNYIAPSIVGYIGFDLTIKCLTSITSSATNICSLLTYISTHSCHADMIFEIQKLDLDTDIEGTTLLLAELQPRLNETTHTQSLAYNVKKLYEIINKIENLLIQIHEKLAYNKSLVIASGMRAYKIEGDIEVLKSLKNTFKERRTTLFEVIKINPYLRPYHPSQEKKEICLDESMIII
jgi:hypothetical protein